MLPIKTLIEDIDGLSAYLNGQVGWVPLEKAKKTIDTKLLDARKLDAAKRLGLLDRDGTNIRLTEEGRAYASGDAARQAEVMRAALRRVPIYTETLEWMHHSKIKNPTKAVVGNYWHDKHQEQLEGAQGAALTDAVIFFMRVAGAANLGKFTRGSKHAPDSYFKTDASAIENFVTSKSDASPVHEEASDESQLSPAPAATADAAAVTGPAFTPPTPAAVSSPVVEVSASPAVHVNIEIHIAADATAETVAEIFKNMRKYVLNNPDDAAS